MISITSIRRNKDKKEYIISGAGIAWQSLLYEYKCYCSEQISKTKRVLGSEQCIGNLFKLTDRYG